jgi:hypothetical protein
MVLNKPDIANYNDNYNVLDKQLIIQYPFSNAVFNSVPYESNRKFNHNILYKYDKYSVLPDTIYNRYNVFFNDADHNGNYVFLNLNKFFDHDKLDHDNCHREAAG